MNEDNLVQVEWRLINMMVERRIRRVTDLRKKLLALGIEISSQQMGRLVNQFPERLNTTYLRGLLTVLDCDISDLIRVHSPGSAIDPKEQEKATEPSPATKKGKKAKPTTERKLPGPALPPGFDD